MNVQHTVSYSVLEKNLTLHSTSETCRISCVWVINHCLTFNTQLHYFTILEIENGFMKYFINIEGFSSKVCFLVYPGKEFRDAVKWSSRQSVFKFRLQYYCVQSLKVSWESIVKLCTWIWRLFSNIFLWCEGRLKLILFDMNLCLCLLVSKWFVVYRD